MHRRCDDPAAPELDTDPEVRAEGYSRLLSLLRRGQYGVAGIFLLVIALVVGALIGLAINALINSVTPYLEQAMGELGSIGNSGDLGELTELIEQFGSL